MDDKLKGRDVGDFKTVDQLKRELADALKVGEEKFPSGAPYHAQPGYIGQYFVEFMDGSARLLNLVGSVRDINATPIYLVGHDKTFYTYHNVISVRKVKPNG